MQNPQLADLIESATQEHIDQVDGYLLPLLDSYMDGDERYTYSGDFWLDRSPLVHADQIRAPTIITGALQDIFQRDAPLLYERIKQNAEARLVIYDSDHIRNFFQAIPGNDLVDGYGPLALFWFDKYLKGKDLDIDALPPVTQYVKNLGSMRNDGFVPVSDWPHPQISPQRWYLHGDFSVDMQAPSGDEDMHYVDAALPPGIFYGKSENGKRLQAEVVVTDGSRCSVSYRQWTLGFAGLLLTDGIPPHSDCYNTNTELEKDALNFETAPMIENYYINGPIQADIWIETTGENAVLSVWLDEVTPAGESLPISNGLLLASARAVDESRSRFINGEMIQPYFHFTKAQEAAVIPGEVFKMQIEIFPTSYIIRKGNRLRVSIASSNQAQGILNDARQAQVNDSTMTIHNSAQYPSSVLLPAVPLSTLEN
jgi:predicted acyl esterase